MPNASYLVKYEQSIFDVAIQLYGSVDTAVKLYFENTDVAETINEDLEGIELTYDMGFKQTNTVSLVTVTPPQVNLSQTYNPSSFQTIFDVALMLDGNLSGVVALVHNSTLNNINTEVKMSDSFNYTKKKSGILTWIERTGQVFQTKTPIEGNNRGAFDGSFSGLEFN